MSHHHHRGCVPNRRSDAQTVSVKKRDTEHPGMGVNNNGQKAQCFGMEGSEKWGVISYFQGTSEKEVRRLTGIKLMPMDHPCHLLGV